MWWRGFRRQYVRPFSSPEHKVLRVSYFDSASSKVFCAASTFYLVYVLEARFLVLLSWNLVRMFVLTELPTVTAESELIRFLGKIEEHSGQYVFSHSVRIAQISSKT